MSLSLCGGGGVGVLCVSECAVCVCTYVSVHTVYVFVWHACVTVMP